MGIKDLWTILTPFSERKPLYELSGKKVAIDLSGWVCESQNITQYSVQPRMYLRNLYFRTCFLLLMDVYPVFILEGKAPELKYDTIAARNELQFKGARPRQKVTNTAANTNEENEKKTTNKKGRSRFDFTLKQCQEMLRLMGVACIKSKGEAEALCAYLNEDGLVDGIISQDSDCFAYGAKIVYRNFSISQQGAHAGTGGSVDVYSIEKAYKSLNFGRNKIIALALLCGSDYSEGIHGIGKDSALKLFTQFNDEQILNRLESWTINKELFEAYQKDLDDKSICVTCGHKGRTQSHSKLGCMICRSVKGCDPNGEYKERRTLIKNELNMRSKVLNSDENFPNRELINEFLIRKEDKISELNLKWRKPDLIQFINFTTKFLNWLEIYSFEKFLPILTRWQLINYELIQITNQTQILFPNFIKKRRNPKSIKSYEIVWFDKMNYFPNLIPNEQFESDNINLEKLWSTIEPEILVQKAYPELVESFENSKKKPSKKKTTKKTDEPKKTINEQPKKPNKRKLKKDLNQINQLMADTSLVGDSPIRKISKTNTIDNYFKEALIRNHLERQNVELIANTSTPIKNQSFSDWNLSRFDDDDVDDNESDLSGIIDEIIARKPPDYIQNNLKELGLKPIIETNDFFISKNQSNRDLFEASLNYKYELSSTDDEDQNISNPDDVNNIQDGVGNIPDDVNNTLDGVNNILVGVNNILDDVNCQSDDPDKTLDGVNNILDGVTNLPDDVHNSDDDVIILEDSFDRQIYKPLHERLKLNN